MKVQPVASAHAVQHPQSNEAARTAKAVAAFNNAGAVQAPTPQPQAHNHGQINQNQVSPEEMSSLQGVRQPDTMEPEATEEQPKEAPKAEDPALSRQFAQLARQEKQLRLKAQQQEQAIKAREMALQAREAELSAKDNQYRQGYYSKDQIKQDAMTILADAGVSYDDLVQQIVTQTPQDPRTQRLMSQMEAKIKALEEQNTQTQKTWQEQQTQAYEAAVKQIRTDVKSLVYTDPSFETIKAMKATEDVVELIKQTFEKDGVLLTNEEAANQVEEYLVERGLEVAKLKKIQAKIAQSNGTKSTPAAPSGPAKTAQQQPMKTLTNATSSTRQLSAKERAMLAFKGELK